MRARLPNPRSHLITILILYDDEWRRAKLHLAVPRAHPLCVQLARRQSPASSFASSFSPRRRRRRWTMSEAPKRKLLANIAARPPPASSISSGRAEIKLKPNERASERTQTCSPRMRPTNIFGAPTIQPTDPMMTSSPATNSRTQTSASSRESQQRNAHTLQH